MRPLAIKFLLAFASAHLLAGCGGRIDGALLPVEGKPVGGSSVQILVATSRSDREIKQGEVFNGERGSHLAYAAIDVSIPPENVRKAGEVQWPTRSPPDAAHEFAATRVSRISEAQALQTVHAGLKDTQKRSVLIFVHGYNTRFDEAVFRLAQIVHDAKAPVVPVLFTWPSRGRLLGYAYDRESANFSRDQLERVLQTFAADRSVGEITILAHSMGNWVTIEALRQMAIRNKAIAPKIQTVMLAAPDVDVDVFRQQIKAIGDARPPFIVFVSQDDKALSLSKRLWGGERLGMIDPNAVEIRRQLEAQKIQVVDLTNETSTDSLNHAKFASSPEVVRLLSGRILAGQVLHDSNAGLGEKVGLVATGAASTVGRAASIVVSAPLAVVDPRTRDGLGDQVEDLGRQIGNTAGHTGAAIERD